MLTLNDEYDYWSVAVLTVTLDVIFSTFDFVPNRLPSALKSICHPHFFISNTIMDLPLFAIAKWASLLVDIHCPRGRS